MNGRAVRGGTYGKELYPVPLQVANYLGVLSVRFIHRVYKYHHEHEDIKGDLDDKPTRVRQE